MEDTLMLLECDHEQILEALLAHQDAVAEGEAAKASRLLQVFAEQLFDHIRMEEEMLFPIFADRVPEQPGCTTELLGKEHRKLERLVHGATQLVETSRMGGTLPPRARVEIIDHERMLKEVLDHHATREREAFFPRLDEVTTPDERAAILSR